MRQNTSHGNQFMKDNDTTCEVCEEPFPEDYGKFDPKAPVYADDYVVHKGCEDEIFEWSVEIDSTAMDD